MKSIIYYKALQTLIKYTYFHLPFIYLKRKNADNIIALHKYIPDSLELVYIKANIKLCYYVLTSFIVDYS